MSSIRPLATITLLAVAGFILYLKITETEPVIPEGVGDYEFNVGLDNGVGAPEAWSDAMAGDSGGTAPEYSAAAGGAAPAFAPSTNVDAGGAAPAWNGGDATAEAPAFDATTAAAEQSVPSFSEDAGSEPAMPELPDDPSVSEPAVDAHVAVPDMTAPSETMPSDATAAESAPSAADVTESGRYGAMPTEPNAAATSADILPTETPAASSGSLYAEAKVAIQSALDRGNLSQALVMLTDWREDPSLTPAEREEVSSLLSQLAGTVIYSRESRLEDEYMVQPGETLDQIAAKYQVPPQLLGKINGIGAGTSLQAGQKLKVLRGPFSAVIDLSDRQLVLTLDRMYAGKFPVNVDSTLTVEDGQWEVTDKPLAPASATAYQAAPTDGVDRTVVLQNAAAASGQVAVLRGPGASDPVAPEPQGRVIRLSSRDIEDVFDILSVGSTVTIRR